MSRTNAIMIAIVWLIAATAITIFIGSAGMREPQPLMGIGTRITEGFGSIMQFHQFRLLLDQITDPFGIRPTRGEYEVTPDRPVRPDQAFDIEIRGTETVLLDREGLITFVKVTNQGSTTIERMDVELDLGSPFSGCVEFSGAESKYDSDFEVNVYSNIDVITSIPPGSSKELVFRNGKIHMDCLLAKVARTSFDANTPIGGVNLIATGSTVYSTASRLAVERIEQEQGEILIRNNVLVQRPTGAIYRSGSAVTIDLDVGVQPILAPRVGDDLTVGLIMRYMNVGRGDMIGEPMLFIITPRDFGRCQPAGLEAQCNNVNIFTFMREITRTYSLGRNVLEVTDWMEDISTQKRTHNVCYVLEDVEEFDVVTCTVDIPPIRTTEKRLTDYITVFALYGYERRSSRLDIRTWCTSDMDDCV